MDRLDTLSAAKPRDDPGEAGDRADAEAEPRAPRSDGRRRRNAPARAVPTTVTSVAKTTTTIATDCERRGYGEHPVRRERLSAALQLVCRAKGDAILGQIDASKALWYILAVCPRVLPRASIFFRARHLVSVPVRREGCLWKFAFAPGETIESALRRFKKATQKAGVLAEARKHEQLREAERAQEEEVGRRAQAPGLAASCRSKSGSRPNSRTR